MKHNSNMKQRLTRIALIATLILAALPAQAADYVLAYVNGNTTYYLARNGTDAVQRVTTFDPTTCIWHCASNTDGTTAGTLNNSNTYGYLYQMVDGTRYFLGAPDADFALATNVPNNYYRWRTNGTYVYNRYSGTYSYYINLANGVARNTTANTASNARPYEVTTTTVESTSTNPTITGTNVLTVTGTSNFTATGAAFRIGYSNYNFNNANHYFDADGNSFTGTPANATLGTPSWSLTSNDYATVNNSGTVTVSSLPVSDVPLTITVTISVTGGTPAAPAGTTLTTSKEIVLQGTKPSAPIITASGNSVTITTEAAGTTTIRYTLDGTTPTASTGTVYSGAIDLSSSATSPVTIKAVTVRNGNASDVSTEVVTLTVPAPVITVDPIAGTASISATAGATIYYTTDGTTPTASSSQYSGTLTGLAMMTTVSAIAVKSGWNDSPVASELLTISSNVTNGIVTLFDYEPHSWSYYSDASLPDQLHSLNPADVKITYYGDGIMMTGSADYTASSTDFVQPGNANYVGGAKVNVGGENENTFVYYKTLERANADGTGRCPYTPIPNPFQVRPTYGTRGSTDANDFTGWRGFQCWRLKSVSGGAVYSVASGGTALTTGAVINAETPIYLAPNAEYGMEVELEAVWAIAYVKKANQANENPVGTNNVGYERNFCVPTTGAGYTLYAGTGKRITNANHIPVTISRYYPDGTAPDNTNNSISNTAFALTADTKFENIPINLTSNTVTLDNYDIIVGRGCGTSTINNLQGINAGATDLDYTIRVESGTFNQFCFVRSGTNTTVSGRYLIKAIMGSDYDRATGTNDKLIVAQNSSLFFAQTVGFTGSSNKDQKTFDCVFKSGTYQSDQWDEDQNGTNGYQHIAYLGQNSAQGNTYPGVRCVTVEGGELGGMCGGRGVSSSSNSSTYMTPEVITFDLRIKGGTFHGGVFGGAADNPSIGSRRFIMTGGEIWSWLAGGCNGTGSQTGSGATDGNSYIYVGGTALVGGDHAMCLQNTNGGQVFGAGRGLDDTRTSSVNYSYVAIADEAVISNNNNNTNYAAGGNVYGGSYNGTIVNEANVYILGGTVQGGVYGGSYGNATNSPVPAAKVSMTGGLVTGGVYGGSNNKGTVGDVEMHINGGQVGTSSNPANIHGGGYGQQTRVNQNVDITLGETNQTEPGVTVYGDVYGGSAMGLVNGTSTNTTYHTNVTLNKATINGSVYGGGLGEGTTAANVYSPVTVTVNGGSVTGGVYGCNNVYGAPQSTVTVDVYGTDPAPAADSYAIHQVFGGGNQAAYSGTPEVTVHCTNESKDISICELYGGGNQATVTGTRVVIDAGNIIGDVYGGGRQANVGNDGISLTVGGGTVRRVFGGNNIDGTIAGGTANKINITVDKTSGCPLKIGELYGGGNLAGSQAGNITIGCTGTLTDAHNAVAADTESNPPSAIGYTLEGIGDVYGGANNALVTGNITLNIVSGMIYRVFGGNNTGNTVNGTITVNVAKGAATCGWYVGYVYGGGNNAPYTNAGLYPKVNVSAGKVTYNVYGGGKGYTAKVTGNPQVTLSGTAHVGGNVFGGGNAAEVEGNPNVLLKN